MDACPTITTQPCPSTTMKAINRLQAVTHASSILNGVPGQMQSGTPAQNPRTSRGLRQARFILMLEVLNITIARPTSAPIRFGTAYPNGRIWQPARAQLFNERLGRGYPKAVNDLIGTQANYYRIYRQESDLAIPGAANTFSYRRRESLFHQRSHALGTTGGKLRSSYRHPMD